MGAEACGLHPSRVTNCAGQMVLESVLQQTVEEEQVLEDVGAATEPGRLQSPGGCKLLVAMKLNAPYCQEILERTLTELAVPGDRILAFHVASCPPHSGRASCEHEEYFEQLADSLGGLLDVYEELCNLRQIKLEIEVIPGEDWRKVLVEYARSHGACTLILGSHKHFTVRRSKSLGRYCLRRLPDTCTVAVLERGEIILNEQGWLRTSTGPAGMIRTLRRSLRSFGRRSKKAIRVESEDDPPSSHSSESTSHCRSAEGFEFAHRHSTDNVGKDYYSDTSSSFQGFRRSFQGFMTSPLRDFTKRADMLILEDVTSSSDSNEDDDDDDLETEEEPAIPGWPLMHVAMGFDTESQSVSLPCPSVEEASLVEPPIHRKTLTSGPLHVLFSEEERSDAEFRKAASRSPLHRMSSSLKKSLSLPSHFDRLDWSLKLPSRTKDTQLPKSPTASITFAEEVYAKLLQEIALDAFRSKNTVEADLGVIEEKDENFSLNVTEAGQEDHSSLVLKLDQLCSDRKCITFLYKELEAGTSHFSSSNVVGRGGGSEVYKGKLPGGRLVAVKRLNDGPQAEEELLNDVGITTSLSHPHIVSLLGYCVDSPHLILVYDYLPEGNLEDRLHALSWRVRHKVAVGTAKALDYLHNGTSRPVIHRDVKSSNILLTSEFESQLSDFGLAKWAPKTPYLLCNDILGTFGYLAPEYFKYGRVNNKTDVYAFGVVLLELITGRTPIDTTKPKGQENLVNWAKPLLEGKNLETLVDARLKGVYDVDQMKRMVLAASLCVHQNPRRRPQMSQVLQILCSSHPGRLQTTMSTSEETSTDFSEDLYMDLEGDDLHMEEEEETLELDMQTHLALALLGMDDHDVMLLTRSYHSSSVLGQFTSLPSSLVQ